MSAAENDFVFSLVDAPEFWLETGNGPNFGPWLGGFQPPGSVEPDGGWEWLNNDGGFGVEDVGAYTNWHPPFEPNDHLDKSENALEFIVVGPDGLFDRGPFWNDSVDFLGQSGGYVVEFLSLDEPVERHRITFENLPGEIHIRGILGSSDDVILETNETRLFFDVDLNEKKDFRTVRNVRIEWQGSESTGQASLSSSAWVEARRKGGQATVTRLARRGWGAESGAVYPVNSP